jgi:single-stranded-DNA-specific exonuclease
MIDSTKNSHNWPLREMDEGAALHLASTIGVDDITARVLVGRGISDADEARDFLDPQLAQLPDPFTIPGMGDAVGLIAKAIESNRRIGIFGDYDVDGVTASALLADFLGSLGRAPVVLLPERLERGYGIDPEAIDRLKSQGTELIITVDNGIRAQAAAERARATGVQLIITDHHMPEGELPKADAIVNPKLMEDDSSLTNLSGCGVAFMLAMALRKHLRDSGVLPSPEPNLRSQLDVVALGTIADIMPLRGVNRVLTSFGLAEISRAERLGVRALLDASGAWPSDVTPGTVAFRLAPRINAAGRMGSAMRAFDLLLTSDEGEARLMAKALDKANGERQRLEERALREAMRTIERMDDLPEGIVVHSTGWHVGVIGIVAAKLVEKFGKPAVVISLDADPPRGSARCPEGMDLLAALKPCADRLVQYGGHAQAAGLAIESDEIDGFTSAFAQACGQLGKDKRATKLKLDAVVEPHKVTERLVTELARCAPFGVGNPEPILALENASVIDQRVVGNGHLKLTLASEGKTFEAIGFNMADAFTDRPSGVHVAFTPQFNTWNGRTTIQLKLKDITPANKSG